MCQKDTEYIAELEAALTWALNEGGWRIIHNPWNPVPACIEYDGMYSVRIVRRDTVEEASEPPAPVRPTDELRCDCGRKLYCRCSVCDNDE